MRVRGYHCILYYLYARNDCCKLPGRTFSFVATEQTHQKKSRYGHPNNHLRKAGAVSYRRSVRRVQGDQPRRCRVYLKSTLNKLPANVLVEAASFSCFLTPEIAPVSRRQSA